ncbi:SAM-dependent methyltransferase [soil metagenome]
MSKWLSWRAATTRALYGADGFYRRTEGPAGHFRTSVHASPLFARALLELIADVDTALGEPATLDLVDVGAGRGELLTALADQLAPPLAGRVRLHGVDIVERPAALPDCVGWSSDIPRGLTGLLIANEWLDDVPLDVIEVGHDGLHVVLVDPASGQERLGGPPEEADARWLDRWWPLDPAEVGDRTEVGRTRDEAWADAVGALDAGLAVAIDYAHTRDERAARVYAGGTLTGWRSGRPVPPVPDGSCDVTAHVALDACAVAGAAAGAESTLLLGQREALHALGVRGSRPPLARASGDPRGYLAALATAGEAAELTDQGGLGGYTWLLQAVNVPLPTRLRTQRLA